METISIEAVGGLAFVSLIGAYTWRLIRRSDSVLAEQVVDARRREADAVVERDQWRALYFQAIGHPQSMPPPDSPGELPEST